jgi:predicted DNA-binding antitoxin AbrB/MazE fold protein
MISKRTLVQWRIDALRKLANPLQSITVKNGEGINIALIEEAEVNERILRLTQELIDLDLIKKGCKS